VNELLSQKPELLTCTDESDSTALHFASANGHIGSPIHSHLSNGAEIIRLILDRLHPISPKNSSGNTPLHWACLNNQVDAVKLLVEDGADMFIKNNAGKDAIWEVQQRDNEELVGWLLVFGEEQIEGQVTLEDSEDVDVGDEIDKNGDSMELDELKEETNQPESQLPAAK
jgi:uncharacterized protein